jgi:hypothetical protein
LIALRRRRFHQQHHEQHEQPDLGEGLELANQHVMGCSTANADHHLLPANPTEDWTLGNGSGTKKDWFLENGIGFVGMLGEGTPFQPVAATPEQVLAAQAANAAAAAVPAPAGDVPDAHPLFTPQQQAAFRREFDQLFAALGQQHQ